MRRVSSTNFIAGIRLLSTRGEQLAMVIRVPYSLFTVLVRREPLNKRTTSHKYSRRISKLL